MTESPYAAFGPKIGVRQAEVPTGSGYLLHDGTMLRACERDAYGNYRDGAGLDQLYTPAVDAAGRVYAFQEVRLRETK